MLEVDPGHVEEDGGHGVDAPGQAAAGPAAAIQGGGTGSGVPGHDGGEAPYIMSAPAHSSKAETPLPLP